MKTETAAEWREWLIANNKKFAAMDDKQKTKHLRNFLAPGATTDREQRYIQRQIDGMEKE